MEFDRQISVVIADDHPIMRQGLRTLIEREPGIEVTGEASTGTDVVKLAETSAPDVVVMDVNMPEMDGVEASRRILNRNQDVKILILSSVLTIHIIDQTIVEGVLGIMMKESAFSELCQAVRTVNKGKRYFCSRIMNVVVNSYVGHLCYDGTEYEPLTDREREVVRQFSNGRTSKEIAVSIDMSDKAVDASRRRIMEKLHLNSTAGLVKYALRTGLSTL